MDSFTQGWLAGWTRGMAKLSEKQRAAVFAECGKACATPELLPLYRQMFAEAKNADAFFTAVNRDVDGLSVDTVEPGTVYDFCYPRCLCPLHTEGGVNDGTLCECSRESLLWLMRELFPGRRPKVELLQSILRGDRQCRLRVRLS
jgi:hypothetical protein